MCCIKYHAVAAMGFLRRGSGAVRGYATKCAAVKFVNRWKSSHVSEWRERSYDNFRGYWNVPGIVVETSPAGCTNGEVDQGPGGVIESPTLLGVVSSTISEFTENEAFRVHRFSCLHDPPMRKSRYENEWMNVVSFWVCMFLLAHISVGCCSSFWSCVLASFW